MSDERPESAATDDDGSVKCVFCGSRVTKGLRRLTTSADRPSQLSSSTVWGISGATP